MIPQSTARESLGLSSIAELRVAIDVGAGDVVGGQLPYALVPGDPTSLAINAPTATDALETRLTGDVNVLFLVLAIIATGIGVLTIAVTTSLSVMERRGEIGLRRALGATGGHVVGLLLVECAVTGWLGGLFGAGAGVCAVVGIAIANEWTPILDIRLIVVASIAGVALGMAGGLVPAVRASRLEPSVALQEGT
jgi:putative ABC transport system permease protein